MLLCTFVSLRLFTVPPSNHAIHYPQYSIRHTQYEFGHSRSYPQPKSENSKKIFTIFNSLPHKDLSSLTQYSSRFTRYEFCTKRAASPHCRGDCFFCPRSEYGIFILLFRVQCSVFSVQSYSLWI